MVSNEGSPPVTGSRGPPPSRYAHSSKASLTLRNTRVPHGKRSKSGCLLCKARKVKCGEEHPTCKNCLLRKSECRYPSHVSVSVPPSASTSVVARQPSPVPGPTPSAMMFSMREMRFFQQFLISIPHALPIGNRSVWLNELPQLAHQQSFLMHSLLALGASDLQRVHTDAQIEYDMLQHRGRAILGLKNAIEDLDSWTQNGHADAVLAACYSLTYQSSHLPDALTDFDVFVKGCALATGKIRESGMQTALNVSPEWPQRKLEAALQHLQDKSLDVPLVRRALYGIDQVLDSTSNPYCHAFGRAMQQTIGGFRESAAKGFLLSSIGYNQWYDLGSGLLQALRDPSDPAPMILGAYFLGDLAMTKLVIPLHLYPDTPRTQLPIATLRQMATWVEAINDTVPESAQQLLAWPNEMMARVDGLLQGVDFDPALADKLQGKLDIIRNLDSRAHMLVGELIFEIASEMTTWFETFVEMMYDKVLGTVSRREGLLPRFSPGRYPGPATPASATSKTPSASSSYAP